MNYKKKKKQIFKKVRIKQYESRKEEKIFSTSKYIGIYNSYVEEDFYGTWLRLGERMFRSSGFLRFKIQRSWKYWRKTQWK